VDCRSPALDSGFRRNEVSLHVVSNPVMPEKAGAFRYPVCFSSDALSSYGQFYGKQLFPCFPYFFLGGPGGFSDQRERAVHTPSPHFPTDTVEPEKPKSGQRRG